MTKKNTKKNFNDETIENVEKNSKTGSINGVSNFKRYKYSSKDDLYPNNEAVIENNIDKLILLLDIIRNQNLASEELNKIQVPLKLKKVGSATGIDLSIEQSSEELISKKFKFS